jgi:heme exporter protein D
MIEFLNMGKHTEFIYIAYIFAIIVLLAGYLFPHFNLKKEIKKKKYENNKKK